MPQTWNLSYTWCNHVPQVVLIAVVSWVSACTTLGHSSANPSVMPSVSGYPGTADSGHSDADSGM
jgi:hypothetical protein